MSLSQLQKIFRIHRDHQFWDPDACTKPTITRKCATCKCHGTQLHVAQINEQRPQWQQTQEDRHNITPPFRTPMKPCAWQSNISRGIWPCQDKEQTASTRWCNPKFSTTNSIGTTFSMRPKRPHSTCKPARPAAALGN